MFFLQSMTHTAKTKSVLSALSEGQRNLPLVIITKSVSKPCEIETLLQGGRVWSTT